MNKNQAKTQFIESILGGLTIDDKPMIAEAWNNFTDYLCKSGEITNKQYASWTHPVFTKQDFLKAKGLRDATRR